tara:strand:+ start:74 stop:253 length:180 start_codon:yes stop_codon:yes gene_type:complete
MDAKQVPIWDSSFRTGISTETKLWLIALPFSGITEAKEVKEVKFIAEIKTKITERARIR